MSKLLVISPHIDDTDLFISGLAEGVNHYYRDNIDDYSLEELVEQIKQENIEQVGFVYHSSEENNFPFFGQDRETQYYTVDFLSFVEQVKDTVKILDLITCNLRDEQFKLDTAELEQSSGIDIRYSVNKTGIVDDWIMESDNVDIKYEYFTDEIDKWNHSLVYFTSGASGMNYFHCKYSNKIYFWGNFETEINGLKTNGIARMDFNGTIDTTFTFDTPLTNLKSMATNPNTGDLFVLSENTSGRQKLQKFDSTDTTSYTGTFTFSSQNYSLNALYGAELCLVANDVLYIPYMSQSTSYGYPILLYSTDSNWTSFSTHYVRYSVDNVTTNFYLCGDTLFRRNNDGSKQFDITNWQNIPSSSSNYPVGRDDTYYYYLSGSTIIRYNHTTNTVDSNFSISSFNSSNFSYQGRRTVLEKLGDKYILYRPQVSGGTINVSGTNYSVSNYSQLIIFDENFVPQSENYEIRLQNNTGTNILPYKNIYDSTSKMLFLPTYSLKEIYYTKGGVLNTSYEKVANIPVDNNISRMVSDGTNIFMYGSFSEYDGVSVGKMIKVDNDLNLDTTFTSGVGSNYFVIDFYSGSNHIISSRIYDGSHKYGYFGINKSTGLVDRNYHLYNGFGSISYLGIDSNESLYIGTTATRSLSNVWDYTKNFIKIDSDGTENDLTSIISSYQGTSSSYKYPRAFCQDSSNRIYITLNQNVYRIVNGAIDTNWSGTFNGSSVTLHGMKSGSGYLVKASKYIYIGDYNNNRVVRYDTTDDSIIYIDLPYYRVTKTNILDAGDKIIYLGNIADYNLNITTTKSVNINPKIANNGKLYYTSTILYTLDNYHGMFYDMENNTVNSNDIITLDKTYDQITAFKIINDEFYFIGKSSGVLSTNTSSSAFKTDNQLNIKKSFNNRIETYYSISTSHIFDTTNYLYIRGEYMGNRSENKGLFNKSDDSIVLHSSGEYQENGPRELYLTSPQYIKARDGLIVFRAAADTYNGHLRYAKEDLTDIKTIDESNSTQAFSGLDEDLSIWMRGTNNPYKVGSYSTDLLKYEYNSSTHEFSLAKTITLSQNIYKIVSGNDKIIVFLFNKVEVYTKSGSLVSSTDNDYYGYTPDHSFIKANGNIIFYRFPSNNNQQIINIGSEQSYVWEYDVSNDTFTAIDFYGGSYSILQSDSSNNLYAISNEYSSRNIHFYGISNLGFVKRFGNNSTGPIFIKYGDYYYYLTQGFISVVTDVILRRLTSTFAIDSTFSITIDPQKNSSDYASSYIYSGYLYVVYKNGYLYKYDLSGVQQVTETQLSGFSYNHGFYMLKDLLYYGTSSSTSFRLVDNNSSYLNNITVSDYYIKLNDTETGYIYQSPNGYKQVRLSDDTYTNLTWSGDYFRAAVKIGDIVFVLLRQSNNSTGVHLRRKAISAGSNTTTSISLTISDETYNRLVTDGTYVYLITRYYCNKYDTDLNLISKVNSPILKNRFNKTDVHNIFYNSTTGEFVGYSERVNLNTPLDDGYTLVNVGEGGDSIQSVSETIIESKRDEAKLNTYKSQAKSAGFSDADVSKILSETVSSRGEIIPKNTYIPDSRRKRRALFNIIMLNNKKNFKMRMDMMGLFTAERKKYFHVFQKNTTVDYSANIDDDSEIYSNIEDVGDYFTLTNVGVNNNTIKFKVDAEDTFSYILNGSQSTEQYSPGDNITIDGVQFTFGSVYTGEGSGIPCFHKSAKIFTEKGYKLVSELKEGDTLLMPGGLTTRVRYTMKFKAEKSKETLPYKISVGQYDCAEELLLSRNHCVKLNNFMVPVNMLKGVEQVEMREEDLIYYHIITEDFFNDVIIANGVRCEGFLDLNLLDDDMIERYETLLYKNTYIRRMPETDDDIKTIIKSLNIKSRRNLVK